ncbi:hypothetical protein A3I27_02775 [Candidatus Giovannonibacteria bacterium RIFCSPLOWO2_02_FULL_43_11b]|uniref:Type II secretion system protein GspF domain-containing protein n=1 Tax=Candidatus Giovannonibacteria bacterium RIFCSPHIGHO2_12_FULL_43_15 TaxID=1798341 RepID=A0A1F5WRW2_9BACT|nr:MAG: hypothetical protein A3B97_00540 [Candidatus Giovannonibacteria bacterium RIFCSPHIGHO2_02_FULL_43_32]OGF78360.1 MAG: hypothetical protein A3F23_01975 [Candidatus Giovannonibacteria bacterium RIFCSPHIGHO2_12_FULL_43_15]OGF90563.1 MAG: hypothetical protein A3I27_02775 [Candidatus Giovannonibacteria bacterium RIFCSPLOWO2_02_FULL_43_11b]
MTKKRLPKIKIPNLNEAFSASRDFVLTFNARLSLQDQALFARRLSMLSKAGVPILESINIIRRQTKGATRKMFDHIAHDVASGQFLSKSLSKYSRVFGDFAVNIIKVGETSGTLSENLQYLAEEIDKGRELRGKVISALIYPIIILVSSLGISGFLTLYLFPKLMPVFLSLQVDLPVSTRFLIWLSTFLVKYGSWVLLALFLAFFAAAIGFASSKRFRFLLDSVILRMPIAGEVLRHYNLSNICRTLGLLLRGQVRVIEAISVASETSSSPLYKSELAGLREAITKGSNISTYLEKNPHLFPNMLTEMVAIGEKTGNLSETLSYLAQIYEQELAEKTKRLSSVIEPVMMIVMGVLVGFIAISIITPIYEVTQHLNPR